MLRTPLFSPTLSGGPAIVPMLDLLPAPGNDAPLRASSHADPAPGGEIAFVDAGIDDLAALLAGLKRGVEVVMLDSSGDAIAQIATALEGRDSLAAIHIVANGGEGRIDFGAGSIGVSDLAARAGALSAIGGALGAGGDILLWSCNTGAGSIGQAFVESLALATGADVAASTDPTGAAARGGDWVLEAQSGAIEAGVPLTGDGIQAYDGLLDNQAPTIGFTPYEAAASGETLVNTTTNNSQNAPSAAALEGGGHVVIWHGNGPGDSDGVFMQRYDASGAALGGEVRVNTTTANGQSASTVAALNGGGYVVAWQSLNQDGSLGGIYAQRFDASGAAVGGELRVNTHTDNAQLTPSAAGLSDGGYVITWSSALQESGDAGAEAGIYLQRYDASGAPVGAEVHVNTTEAGTQIVPVVAALGDGGYLVVWQSADDIHSQRYDASGAPSGGEMIVSAAPSSIERDPAIAVLSDGGYVVVWEATALDGDGEGIYAQRYDATGAAVGGAFQVNTYTTGLQVNPAITALRDGGYVIAWQSDGQDGSATGTYAQRYDAGDTAVGGEQRINTTTTNSQGNPAIVTLADGSYFIAWSGTGIGDSLGIFGQRIDSHFFATEQVAHDLKGGIDIGDADAGDTLTVTLAVDYGVLHLAAGTSGATIVSGNDSGSVVVSGTAAQIQALLGSDATSVATFTANTDAPPASAALTVTVDDGTATPVSGTTGIVITAVNDAPALDLDSIDFTATGNDAAAAWAQGDAPVVLAPFAVFDDDDADNSYPGATLTVAFTANGTADDQLSIQSVGDGPGELRLTGSNVYYEGTLVGTLSGGNDGNPLVVTFNADACHCAIQLVTDSVIFTNDAVSPDTTDRTVTFTLVDGGGTALGGFDTASADVTLSVSAANIAPEVKIHAPIVPFGDEAQVNTTTAGSQQEVHITALDDGGYVVVWSSGANPSDTGVVGQRYAADGTPVGGEFTVDMLGQFDITSLSVTALEGGGFVVAWADVVPGVGRFVAAQIYDDAGAPVGSAVPVTAVGAGDFPVIAGLSGGGFVVTWSTSDGAGIGIRAQLFDATGTATGSSFVANGTITGTQNGQSVSGLADGGFVVTWTSFNTDSDFTEVFARRFDAAGNPVGSDFRVPTAPTGDQIGSSVTGLANGGFVVSWTQMPTFSNQNVHARLYDAAGNPVGPEFVVDTPSAARQNFSNVTALEDGGFLISWKSGDVSGVGDIYAHRYDATGAAVGGEFRVTDPSLERYAPVAAGLADGGFAIAWMSVGQDGSGGGVYSQVYGPMLSATEQVPLDLKGSITIADVDSGSDIITVTLSVTEGVLAIDAGTSGVSVDDSDPQHIVLTGTLAEIQALLGSDPTSSVAYTYDDDFLPLATIELGVTIDDGTDSATDTVTIGLTPVNDAAELDLDYLTPGNDAVASYVAGDPATPLAFNATFDDDNADWDGATLTIAITGATAGDQISIDDSLMIDTTVVGHDIFYQGDLVGTWSGGDNGNPLVVTFNADACACAIEEVTYGIAYSNSGTITGLSTRDVTFTFVDGDGTANGGADTATATVALTVTPESTPPVIDAGAAATGNEDAVIALTGITITDAGDPATGLVTVHLGVEHGTLTIRTDVAGGIDASNIVNSATGQGITIIATPDQINATLAAANGLGYQGDANFNGADALTITANDGTPDSPLAISSLGAQPFFAFPSAVAFHDVDGDGLDDLILGIGDGSTPGAVLVLAGGIGGFGLPSGAADAFAFGDFDGDGTVDIGIASYADDGSGYVGYYSSLTGDVVQIANVPYALDLIAGDFNGDGLMDLATTNSDGGNIAILLQTAPGAFAPPVYSSATSLLTVSIRTGDFNGDGVLDLLASNYGDSTGFAPPGSVDLFLGNGDGTFRTASPVWTGVSNADGLVVADFNGDGVDDFAFASVDETGVPGGVNGVQVVLGNGDGTFGTATAYVTTTGGRPHNVVAGDLNGDGIADLVVTNSDDPGTVSILLGNGDGSFQAPVDLDTGDSPYVVALGDPDGDGDLDLIVGNAGDGTYEAFNNDGFHRGTTVVKGITVNSVNDAPTGTSATIDAIEDTFRLLSLGDLGFSDIDNAFGSVSIGAVTGGKIYYDADGSAGAGVPVEATLPRTFTAQDLLDGKVSFKADQDANGLALGSITFTVIDDGGASALSANALTVDVTAVADPAIAQPDAVSTAENAVGTGNLFLDNGSGIDRDGDGDSFVITEVNGSAANVGATITLASGAKLTVNADGSYSYDPNGRFVTLTDGSSGAVNTSAIETFTYTLTGGATATVTVTVNGVAGPGDRLQGDGTDNVIHGTGGGDFFIDTLGGDEDWTGLGGNDVFLFGANLTSADKVDGGTGLDQIAIQGDYSTQLTLGTGLIGLESLAILPGFDTRFGDAGTNFYDYNVKTVDENVAAGVTFIVDANRLRAGEDFTFDGSAETDGKFFIYGGGGTDTLTGGDQNDAFYFGEAGQFGASDTVVGGAGIDQLGLRGDYTIVFGATQLVGIENIGMISALDTRFGVLGDTYDYNLTMNNANVLAGQQMTVDAASLRANETLTFNGSAETDGSFRVFGGAGNDVITGSGGDDILVGWAGADSLTGGLGNDVFRYNMASDSTAAARDTIQDFTLGDIVDLSRIDADTGPGAGGDQAFNLIGSAAFGHHAGELRYENAGGNNWTLQGDIDGDGVADFEITVVVADGHGFTASDFLL